MPKRLNPLRNGEIYHIFNRGIDKRVTFSNTKELERAIVCMNYYIYKNPVQKLSIYLQNINRPTFIKTPSEKLVELICYCLMPNHFHFLLKQNFEGGISRFLSNFQNSYTRYFNTKNERTGPLFSTQFKAVHIGTDNQLIHLSRYIHLNPYTSNLVSNFKDLISYPWSSLGKYISRATEETLEKQIILSNFKGLDAYKKFVLDQAHYQKTLKRIKDLTLES